MQVSTINYGSKNAFGQGSEECLNITINLDEKDNVDEALKYAKNYVLSNLNSLEQYGKLSDLLEAKKQELAKTEELISIANQKVNELDTLIKQVKQDDSNT